MTKIAMPYLDITVRRDANTISTIQVPAYEVPLLKNIFGKENITENGPCPVGVELDPEGEYERLSAKYGAERITKFYGEDGGERLKELIDKAVEAADKAAKKPAKTDKTAA